MMSPVKLYEMFLNYKKHLSPLTSKLMMTPKDDLYMFKNRFTPIFHHKNSDLIMNLSFM